ncbi:MAG: MBOAT family O-acyltransferase [Flavobacteriaceae bacterium]|nr:MBOAT family protein [Mangrovimonas sp.]MCB0469425.1 MBOAT family protein [Flavobacteriaceae bacterium]MCB0427121.1 MBOAT family protein [Mangrovimonas sp.]MCB0434409.1 MBOAT family protein [Mangrovimonas sp.]MCB0436308.1 MBOAT family protein [Mangrovimonas sp.]
MLFNSIEFSLFLPIVFALYWSLNSKNLKAQNLLLLIASYIFYGWWDWRFLFLLTISSMVDFYIGKTLAATSGQKKRKYLLFLSLLVNLGILSFFKYYNFFIDSFAQAFTLFGSKFNPQRLDIILPVGISFYTFQTLSYTIDVYKKRMEPTKDMLSFFCYVGFFPQLVAGPIERASNLLPQFFNKRSFNRGKATDGLRQILWGLFKKVVVADNCARYVNVIFADYHEFSGSTLALGLILFSFQIYGDFSGYSDIAIGTARLFGFNFKQNFAFPYFSRNIAEFWRRWHISLTTWFRDYLYIPLGGSRVSKLVALRNIFIVFLISGLWHGAKWTFILWGCVHALLYVPLFMFNLNRKYTDGIDYGKLLPRFSTVLMIASTYIMTTLAWVFFRSDSIKIAFHYLKGIFTFSSWDFPVMILTEEQLVIALFFSFFMLCMEWLGRFQKHALESLGLQWPAIFRLGFYYILVMVIFLFGAKEQPFIYFQF